MADIKKEQERDELHRAIWAIADDLRGSVDGWDFKSYVLGTMFYRYISENLTNYINQGEWDAGNTDFDYAKMSDAEAVGAAEGLVEEKGFFILPSELFCNVRRRAPQDENLNETLERVFNHIEDSAKGSESENSFAGLFDDFDVNSNKLGATVAKRNDKLVKLLNGVGDMNLGDVKDHSIDAFGDAYEYLMTMYASNAGKSGGEFFTPADVSELLTRLGTVGKTEINKVYDPACGSGSLLLKAEKVLGRDAVRNGFYGQEINITTYNLCRINMFLHDIGFDKFDIACEDTLTSPQHWDDEPFELIVSNPPYSIKWAGDENPLLINDPRFAPAGVLAPKSKADLAFIMHSLSWLAPNGTAAIVCFPGIMYRGGAEQKIRRYLIDNNFVDCVIQLPTNLFFGTSIATCIMVLKKSKADSKVLFIDATNECIKVTNNNKLTQANMDRIVETYAQRREDKHFSHLAGYEEVAENDYNLSVSTYVEAEDTREKVDIQKLNAESEEIVAREDVLRREIDAIIMGIGGGRRTSRLDDLIAEYCPDGVEYKPFCEITKMTAGDRITKAEMTEEGLFPAMGAGVSPTGKYKDWNRRNCITISRAGAGAGSIGWHPEEFWATDVCFTAEEITEIATIKFVYYAAKSKETELKQHIYGGSMPKIDKVFLWHLPIPVPPMPVQREIVRILDNFTELTAELTTELTTELTARKKQYEYYRDKLLTFNEIQ